MMSEERTGEYNRQTQGFSPWVVGLLATLIVIKLIAVAI
jgi:hypothetical protein